MTQAIDDKNILSRLCRSIAYPDQNHLEKEGVTLPRIVARHASSLCNEKNNYLALVTISVAVLPSFFFLTIRGLTYESRLAPQGKSPSLDDPSLAASSVPFKPP